QIFQLIQQLPQEQAQIKNTAELINSALIQCEEAITEMQQFADKIQLAPERLQEVEARISSIHQLARKYHLDSKSLQEHEKTLQNELESLQNVESKLAHLHLQLAQINKAYESAALKLRESRKIHAKKLAQEITASIQQLGMPKGWIEIEITPLEKMQAHGLDKVEYKVCTNPGMEPDSLNKIASGGELSRISLAIDRKSTRLNSSHTIRSR
ncbi:DNA repair protein RecN, partial [Legionella taurinensis]|nr:DNA repair protein RecN [Legionella taurinensis]